MNLHLFISIFIFIFIFTIFNSLSLSISQPFHYHHNQKPHPSESQPIESISLTPPLPTSHLPSPSSKCTLFLLTHSFADTMSRPPITVPYSPPSDCPQPWSHVILCLSGEVSGDQYDRIAAVWLAGVEILRTSTPEPFDVGTFWNVEKDISKYVSVLELENVDLVMMLENVVNDEFTGVININLTVLFYKDGNFDKNCRKLGLGFGDEDGDGGYGELDDLEGVDEIKCRKLGLGFGGFGVKGNGGGGYEGPADLVIPVGEESSDKGYWFRIEDESKLASKNVMIPMNANRIVLEMYGSYHGDDEFWYSNPPNRYIVANNLSISRGNGAFREVFVKVDGNYVASEVPFPVVFTGGVNPLFWEPVVAIGAFDLPSYDFELTPFLGSLTDGKGHSFELGVSHALQFWLVDANIHVWLDYGSAKVESKMVVYQPPDFFETRVYNFKQLDGVVAIVAQRSSLYSGWVAFGCGNLTTIVARTVRFKNTIRFQGNGASKTVKQKVKVKTQVMVLSDMGKKLTRRIFKRKYPLLIITSTMPGTENDTLLMTTNISLSLKEKSRYGKLTSSVHNSQKSGGWIAVRDHSVLSCIAETQQILNYHNNSACFVRSVEARGGKLLSDNSTSICPSIFHQVFDVVFGRSSIFQKALNLFFNSW